VDEVETKPENWTVRGPLSKEEVLNFSESKASDINKPIRYIGRPH